MSNRTKKNLVGFSEFKQFLQSKQKLDLPDIQLNIMWQMLNKFNLVYLEEFEVDAHMDIIAMYLKHMVRNQFIYQ